MSHRFTLKWFYWKLGETWVYSQFYWICLFLCKDERGGKNSLRGKIYEQKTWKSEDGSEKKNILKEWEV